jgi:hypothetical protein
LSEDEVEIIIGSDVSQDELNIEEVNLFRVVTNDGSIIDEFATREEAENHIANWGGSESTDEEIGDADKEE